MQFRHTKIVKKSQSATSGHNLSEIVVPEAAALLEFQEIRQSRCISLYPEAPRLPFTVRYPRHIYIEAVQVIRCRKLGTAQPECHNVEVGAHLQGQAGRQLDISADSQCLREIPVSDSLPV